MEYDRPPTGRSRTFQPYRRVCRVDFVVFVTINEPIKHCSNNPTARNVELYTLTVRRRWEKVSEFDGISPRTRRIVRDA